MAQIHKAREYSMVIGRDGASRFRISYKHMNGRVRNPAKAFAPD